MGFLLDSSRCWAFGDFAYTIEHCFTKEILAPSQHFDSPSKQPLLEFQFPQMNKGWFLGEEERTVLRRLDFLFGSSELLWTRCFLAVLIRSKCKGTDMWEGTGKEKKEEKVTELYELLRVVSSQTPESLFRFCPSRSQALFSPCTWPKARQAQDIPLPYGAISRPCKAAKRECQIKSVPAWGLFVCLFLNI